MIDPTKVGATADQLPDLGGGGTPVNPDIPQGEAPWDTLGRLVWGNSAQGGVLGQVPILGNAFRAPGDVLKGLVTDGGWGVGQAVSGLSTLLGNLPTPGHVNDLFGLGAPYRLGPQQPDIYAAAAKYAADPRDPVSVGKAGFALSQDLAARYGGNDFAIQFQALGQWQQQYDPQGFGSWQAALQKAQSETPGQAAETLSKYLREWGTNYADMTPEGVTGWFETHPELAFGGSATVGQQFADGIATIFTGQQHAEKGAAVLSGHQSGEIFGRSDGENGHVLYGSTDYGSRLNELLYLADHNPSQLTDVERAAVSGMREGGWTANHVYNFLISHGQGFSSNAGTETVLGMALDPLTVGTIGAGLAAKVGETAALGYAKTAVGVGRALGTTVAAVRSDPILGPIAKVSRFMIDPLHASPSPSEFAKQNVYTAVGLEGVRKGFGSGAVSAALNRASQWGVRDIADRAFGQTAMNFARKWVVASHIDNLTRFVSPGARRALPEELIQALGENAPKDAVGRLADYVYSRREYFLGQAGQEDLVRRITTMTGQSAGVVRDAVKAMSPDEMAVWHAMTYSDAFRDFWLAKSAVPLEEWGSLVKRLDDLVPLNPAELGDVAATDLHSAISGLKPAAGIKAWNAAAEKYTLIGNLGKIINGGPAMLERRLNALEAVIQSGGLHHELDAAEMSGLPKDFVDQFFGKWGDQWRLGFKPKALQASGVVYDAAGNLVAKYEPAIDNVIEGLSRPAPGGMTAALDAVGRAIPQTVKDARAAQAAGRLKDGLQVAFETAGDQVSAERVMTSIEQRFVRSMRGAGYPAKIAKTVFRQSRQYAQENGFTLAGMTPSDFWKANREALVDVVDEKVAKRDIFGMVADAAGGDMRMLGLTSGMTQRIRSALLARGLNPDNYLGVVSVKAYNALRYALNPTFFLQAAFDAPWFNMYRGVMFDLTGAAPKPGSATYELQGIVEAMQHTSLARSLQMDYTERVATIGWQQEVLDNLKKVPAVEKRVDEALKGRIGRMILNNELSYIGSRIGEGFIDAIETTKQVLKDRAASAATPEEAAQWANQTMDIERVMEYLTQELQGTLGRLPTKDELGRRYYSEMIEDSRMEQRTAEGLLHYGEVRKKGVYHTPSDIGQLQPLDLDYGAAYLEYPNIHSAADLRSAIARDAVMIGDIRDRMAAKRIAKDAVDRFVNGIQFNFKTWSEELRRGLGLTRFEMQGIQDLIATEAKMQGMPVVDYLSQVLPMTAKRATKARYAGEAGARVVTPAELSAIKARGKDLIEGSARSVDRKADVVGNIQKEADAIYKQTMLGPEEYGGATFSPRLGKHAAAEPWVYHGTLPSAMEGITAAGMRAGSNWTSKFDLAQKYAFGKEAPIYRAKPVDVGGTVLSPSATSRTRDLWLEGGAVKSSRMQVSRDAGATWADVVPGSTPGGPYTTAIGKTTSIPIADAQDPAKFKAALEQFVRDNEEALRRQGNYVGTFRDASKGRVEFDVTTLTFTRQDAEAVQAYLGRKGGAYDLSGTANDAGVFAPRLAPKDLGLSEHMKLITDIARLSKQGQAGWDEMTKLVAANLHPSMKVRLLDSFAQRITGKDGLIEQAMKAGDTETAQNLNRVLEDLRGGWDAPATGPVLPEPWRKDAYAPFTENVSLADVRKFMEMDREARPKVPGDFAHLDELTADVKANGFREPATLEYDPEHGLALLADGNHRLAVAQRLGLDSMPVRVVRTTGLDREPAAKSLADMGFGSKIEGHFPADAKPSDLGFRPGTNPVPPGGATIGEQEFRDMVIRRASGEVITDPEVERAARYFSQYVQGVNPQILAGEVLRDVVDSIPVEGASPYDFTQALLMNTLGENFRLAEKDAIRLAHMKTERSVLERSLNHPFFGMYPSSYFWGKVIPETFRFIAKEPFGLKTGLGVDAYLHVKQSVETQSLYDDRMQELWKSVGKSATVGLLSYLSPSMPWEDMRSNLPPWVRSLSKGEDFGTLLSKEFDTFSPERWIKHFTDAAGEVGDAGAAVVKSIDPGQQQQLNAISQVPASTPTPTPETGFTGPVKGADLGPVLSNDMADLEAIFGK